MSEKKASRLSAKKEIIVGSTVLTAIILGVILVVPTGGPFHDGGAGTAADSETPELRRALDKAHELIPELGDAGIDASPIPGLYAVYTGEDIFYFDPERELLVSGLIIDAKTRANLTKAQLVDMGAQALGRQVLNAPVPIERLISGLAKPDRNEGAERAAQPPKAAPGQAEGLESQATPPQESPAAKPGPGESAQAPAAGPAETASVEGAEANASPANAREALQAQYTKVMAMIPDDLVVVYPAKGEPRATLTVFTDYTCPYCKRLHAQIPALNEAGVKVRYLMVARSGMDSATGRSLSNIACSDDPRGAVDAVFAGRRVPEASCEKDNASWQQQLFVELQAKGTPTIFTDQGLRIDGFLDANQLIELIGLKATEEERS